MTEQSRSDLHRSDLTNDIHWQAWCDWASAVGVAIPALSDFTAARARVWEASEYVAISVARHPDAFAELVASGDLARSYGPGELAERLQGVLAEVSDEPALHKALRLFRRREMVRIIWRDIAGTAPLPETLEDLSELADVCIRQALDLLYDWTCAEIGTPRDAEGRPQRLVVLGMGKLGARELNLSSDIDLIFAFAHSGEVEGGPRSLSNQQFFVRLGQRLVQALANKTVDGFVFRVDTRLRPFGDVGPLAMSFQAMEDYYQSQAREWERYAMIKARPVAGAAEDVASLMEMLRPFVYRRYLDFGAFESLRDLKQMIAKELHRRGMDANIKLGPGGIREIEFIGQAFQLVRGGRDADLQVRPIREVLALLAERALLPGDAVTKLDAAYCFLRLVENRLQAHRDKQTHRLPDDDLGRLRLARSMGFADWTSFSAILKAHRRLVQAQFDEVFAAPAAESDPCETGLSAVWQGGHSADYDFSKLEEAGFEDPSAVRTRIEQFRDGTARKGLSSRGSERLAQLMPQVLRIVAGSDHPDLALERVLRVLEAVARRTAYLAMLIEHPVILSHLARLASMSPWFTDHIGRHPLLLDEMIDPRRLYAPLRREDLEGELDALLAYVDAEDLEQQMERLHQFAQGNMLRVAAADLTEVIPLMVVSDYLTEIAEVAVGRVLRLAFDHFVARHGRPTSITGEDTGFLVLGYGKLGGIELGYGSDLDLVFLHGTESITAMTEGPKDISNEQFYARLGQRIIHMMTTQTASGTLYEVDMRLRPDGNKGMLVRSLRSFAAYQETDAWTWEHQALVRARPVAGDAALFAPFAEIRRQVLCRERDPQQLRTQVREMRRKMRDSLDKTRDGRFDLKQGAGGIADIEFMVQYAVLRWAAAHPELTDWTDNVRLLETLARLDLLPGKAADDLTEAYKALRAAYHRSALQEQPKTIPVDQLAPERERVQSLWRTLMED
ncbi:bifunctional [glutamate--ammonia ligase]-adenylyl-L-tyrosine phosphorylase/[glutamate--ammonia-ligase] adenylyltransferase [Thiorhodococcus mannitoliphagus]|uniref:Bifunctional glutamine synthetase adenylyltransferase/adenylyl-removing enzyme n=1 Tax=Thiorhodococcus mannitoliphagus TaxID=329406 RepID=A0A6P1DTS3_9GAMM|nr:bifunctional [glutamate--ammonia ligase]-adenylyl-L-tyrosine phosphorylase/[glutamate--ammonia-ligase] adenylyltransferase [Thiorhodococcus mannitoliphagus]NEX19442.1 bifunctional [glutamate--ammonia ligase]-adenylyl-L-tyrosine phosphorylase/[glutamate--ammonia-ligase] adenylyltransferase [Thiorhodococcus mannitoliphagus]